MIREMDHVSQEKILREVGLFSLEKKRLCKYLKGPSSAYKRSTKELKRNFLQVWMDSNGFKLKSSRFILDIRKKILLCESGEALYCEVVKLGMLHPCYVLDVRLDGALSNQV